MEKACWVGLETSREGGQDSSFWVNGSILSNILCVISELSNVSVPAILCLMGGEEGGWASEPIFPSLALFPAQFSGVILYMRDCPTSLTIPKLHSGLSVKDMVS